MSHGVTRRKFTKEYQLEALCSETGGDEELREMTMESLRWTINPFKEEIARYEARRPMRRVREPALGVVRFAFLRRRNRQLSRDPRFKWDAPRVRSGRGRSFD